MAFNVIAAFIVIALGLGALAPAVVDGAGKETKPPASKTAPLDINTASVDELKALPGIGDA